MAVSYKIGIDLGGTKIEGVLFDDQLNEVKRYRVPTPQSDGYEAILHAIHQLYTKLSQDLSASTFTFGIGTPGAISSRTGRMKNSNTLCLNGQFLLQDLEQLLKRPIAIQNDANCFAMAEAKVGAGKGYATVFGVIMGTGCGGGIVWNGNVHTGVQSIAGEWGHSTINYVDGPLCYCGKKGCVETYISGTGLQNRYKTSFKKTLIAEEIIAAYKSGEPQATTIILNFFDSFGIAISNVINIMDPDVIVLGGGLSKFSDIYTLGIQHVQKYIFNDELKTPIVQHQIGDSAGVLGAALIGV
ncbi:MAG: ROK family protein [Cytophagaceae bacterium]|jgi:fructokinase|nr:ROK family protein [Cytophagaceae bacterium]